ncbi:hypothetical protein J5N97_027453 [Dioscorea zingiberensis]|uniref:Syntaxin N-terminal domain-containing protein n=1 Tax=Dioscorea zingiberensis TaxID=325984 RepID=A0A9D5H7P7_9LILI|nr:hypothetical protein J5N97_027453 [Dioscorea zingiberensis]
MLHSLFLPTSGNSHPLLSSRRIHTYKHLLELHADIPIPPHPHLLPWPRRPPPPSRLRPPCPHRPIQLSPNLAALKALEDTDDLHTFQQLHLQLHNANKETKTVHSVSTMKDLRVRMDTDVEQVLRKAQTVKAKLETLDKANVAHRKLPGSGMGTLADRMRTSMDGGMGTKLKELMDEIQELRTRMAAEY